MEFKKSGFTDEESATLANVSQMYRNIADEEISASDSASFMISQLKAFNIETENAIHIIDALNEVSNNYAVSSADLANNIGKVSATLASSGVTYEEQIGLITAITEITRNASTASRGLKMISSRLVQTLDETSGTGKKLTDIYNKLDIELKDSEGQLRSTYDILKDLSLQWNNLSKNEKEYIALTSAGANQVQNFNALMENFSVAISATATAYSSSGSAMKENEKVIDTIEKKIQSFKSEFQMLVIGEGGLQDFAKNIIQLGTNILKFANSDLGKAIITFGELVTVLSLVNKAWKSLQAISSTNVLASAITSLISGETTLGQVTSVLTKKFIENAIAWATTPMGMATIAIAGIVALGYAVDKYSKRLEEATDKTKELADQSNTTQDEIEGLQNSLKELQDKLTNIKNTKIDITNPEQTKELQKQTRELEAQELSLKRQLALKQAQLEQEKQEEIKQAKKALSTTTSSYYDTTTQTSSYQGQKYEYQVANQVTPVKELELATEKYKELEQQKRSLEQVVKNEINANVTNTEVYKQHEAQLQNIETQIDSVKKRGTEMAEIVQTNTDSLYDMDNSNYKIIDGFYQTIGVFEEVDNTLNGVDATLDDTTEEISEEEQAILDLAEAHGVSAEELKKWAKDIGISEQALVDYADSIGLGVEKTYELLSAIKDWNDGVDAMQSAFDTLNSAIEEYNENGYYSLDTLQALLNIQPEYLSLLSEENGKLTLNESAMTDLVNARIEDRKQIALHTAMERLSALEVGNATNAINSQKSSIDSNIGSINAETTALSLNSVEQAKNAYLRSGISGNKAIQANQIVSDLKKELSILDKLGEGYKAYGGSASSAGRKASGGSKSATDALKDQKKELNDLKSQYDKVISFITGRIDKVIRSIEKEKEKAIGSIDDQIDAKERQKDKAINNIEAQIDALEEQKNAREEYWDAEIDKLKESNDALKDQLELQEKLDALEKAKNTRVKVYKEGQGFVYDVDQTAVAEAQKALDEYLSEKAYKEELDRLEKLKDAEIKNYDDRIDALNKYKDNVERSYEDQIANLKASRDALEEQYDAEIEYYNNYKDQFEEMVKAYEDQQTMLLAKQLTGIDFENNNWLTRLDNLAHFVNEYNKLQAKIGDGSTGNSASVPTSTSSSTSSSKSSSTSDKPTDLKGREAMARISHKAVTYASGSSSIDKDQIAIVGENPNKELVIGSKVNNGTLMALGKGDGVVNSKSTNTLAGLLNQLGNFGTSNFGGGNGILNDSHNESFVVNGVTIQGANITDPQSFVNGLLNMKAEALQRAYRHS